MQRRIAVRAVVLHGDRLLAVRLTSDPARPEKGTFWCLPGGGLEEGEDLLAGLRREMLEETGISPTIGGLVYIQQFKDAHSEYLEFFFAVTNGQDYQDIDLGRTTHGTIEIAAVAFVDPTTVNLLPKFLRTAAIADDMGSGKTQYFNNF